MKAYAAEHGLVEDEEPVPEAVYKKGRLRNIVGFINFKLNDALYANPYRVLPHVYLVCTVALVMSVLIRVYRIFDAWESGEWVTLRSIEIDC